MPNGTCRWVSGLRVWRIPELASFAILAVAATWPLAPNARTCLPLGMEPAATVPLFTTWTVWWNADRAAHLWRGYWDAPIFAPTRGTFAFSEPMPTTAIVAPLVWATGEVILAHNVFLLSALALNGWATFQLLRRLRMRWWICWLGGGMIVLLPLIHGELGVLQMAPLVGVVWTIHALDAFGQRPGLRRTLALGSAAAATYLTCAYYGLFLSLVLLCAGPWLLGKRLAHGRTWALLAGAVGIALLLAAPVLVAQVRTIRTHQLRRATDWMARLAASPADYAVAPWPQRFEPDWVVARRANRSIHLGLGWLKISLAVLGVWAGLRGRRYRRWTLFCATFGTVAFLLSLGPRLAWDGWSPYSLLVAWYPGMAQARNVYRFAVFVQLAVVLLAAIGLQAMIGGRPGFRSRGAGQRRRQSVLGLAVAALGLLAMVEVVPPPQNLFAAAPRSSQRRWTTWLQAHTPPDATIACVPFPDGTGVKDYEQTALWMYWGTIHRRRMVNGYSGFFPRSFRTSKAAMRGFPDADSIRRLREVGVTYCVVRAMPTRQATSGAPHIASPRIPLDLAFHDEAAGIDIYRLAP